MAETRTFNASGIDQRDLARMVSNWLQLNDFESRIMDIPGGKTAVQARQPELWRHILGMSSALNITLSIKDGDLVVEMDAGRWAEKIAVGTVGVFILHPLLITLAYGAWKQSLLPDRVFRVIEEYVNERQEPARATRIPIQSSDEPVPKKDIPEKAIQETAVPEMATQERATRETVFTSAPEGIVCANCGEAANEAAKYCDQCGARLKPTSVRID